MLRFLLLSLAAYRHRRRLSMLVDRTRRGASGGGLGGALLGLVSGLAVRRTRRPGDFRSYLDFIANDPASPPELAKMLDRIEGDGDTPPKDRT